jgi:hypothetical protein
VSENVRDNLALTPEQIQSLSSAGALVTFFTRVGYPTETRLPTTISSIRSSGGCMG